MRHVGALRDLARVVEVPLVGADQRLGVAVARLPAQRRLDPGRRGKRILVGRPIDPLVQGREPERLEQLQGGLDGPGGGTLNL